VCDPVHCKYNGIIFVLAFLFVLTIFLSIYNKTEMESFYFEVSPQRQKCLIEQVSKNYKNRSCSCCQKGTVGGYPPQYLDWFNTPTANGNWSRTDNWTSNENEIQNVPPNNFVPPKNTKLLNTSIYNV
jgi:hypothetical protein